jgi:hypothetical protein
MEKTLDFNSLIKEYKAEFLRTKGFAHQRQFTINRGNWISGVTEKRIHLTNFKKEIEIMKNQPDFKQEVKIDYNPYPSVVKEAHFDIEKDREALVAMMKKELGHEPSAEMVMLAHNILRQAVVHGYNSALHILTNGSKVLSSGLIDYQFQNSRG